MATALHPVPRWGSVAAEQVRAVGLAVRRELLLLVGLLVLLLGVRISDSWESRRQLRAVATTGLWADSVRSVQVAGGAEDEVLISPDMEVLAAPNVAGLTLPLAIVAVLVAFGSWRGARPSRRDYLLAMPVRHESHLLARTLAGWGWLLVALALSMAAFIALEIVQARIAGYSVPAVRPAWQWLVPLASASVVYLLVSAAMIGSRHPWWWIAAAGGALVFLSDGPVDSRSRPVAAASRAVSAIATGRYGANAAMFGDILVPHGPRRELTVGEYLRYVDSLPASQAQLMPRWMTDQRIVIQRKVPGAGRWLGAVALWSAIGAGLVALAIRWRRRVD